MHEKSMKRVDFLINTSNLHVGGGVQVATSFISELQTVEDPAGPPALLLSSDVQRNLRALGVETADLPCAEVLDVQGLDPFNAAARCRMDRFANVFTVFGPLYRWRPPFRNIVGFAQPWIIYPQNECYAWLSSWQRLKSRLKFRIQGWFFRRADVLVVELEHVKLGLIRELGIPAERIHVVHNCLASIFLQPENWRPVTMPEVECDLKLGFLGRNYLHKNTRIFPGIVAALAHDHGIRARIHVTFTEAEWAACTPEFRTACVNLGPLDMAQCPGFYAGLDAVVFPSLLECFSATPLETMAMKRPLFASDRAFNRDICGPHAHYFDPLSPKSAAQAIADVFKTGGPAAEGLRAAREHAIGFSTPAERAKRYLSLLAAPH